MSRAPRSYISSRRVIVTCAQARFSPLSFVIRSHFIYIVCVEDLYRYPGSARMRWHFRRACDGDNATSYILYGAHLEGQEKGLTFRKNTRTGGPSRATILS